MGTDDGRRALALRKAARLALLTPLLYFLLGVPADQPSMATFAAFGLFCLLGFADFGGPVHRRPLPYLVTTAVGAGLIVLGTVVSGSWLLAAVLAAGVGFTIRLIAVFGGHYVAAGTALNLSYVLAATIQGDIGDVPVRLAGWCLAGVVATIAAVTLWPAQERRVLSELIATAVDAIADQLDALATIAAGGSPTGDGPGDRVQGAVDRLRRRFLVTPLRPAGPSAHDRALVYLVDETVWLHSLVGALADNGLESRQCPLLRATAVELRASATALRSPHQPPPPTALEQAREEDLRALRSAVASGFGSLTVDAAAISATIRSSADVRVVSVVTLNIHAAVDVVRDPTHRAFSTSRTAIDVLRAHLRPDSTVFRDALRTGLALAVAIGIAIGGDLSHGLWVALGTLTALRSSASGTGSVIARVLIGTVVGFVVSGLVVTFVHDDVVMWLLMPVAAFLAAYAPTAIGVVVGQASFTVFVVVMFTLLHPEGWATGRARLLDIMVGGAVALVASVALWPRGATAALRGAALAAIEAGASAVAATARHVLGGRDDVGAAERGAAAAGERADEALATSLGEQGSRLLAPAQASSLVTAGIVLRSAAETMAQLPRLPSGIVPPGLDDLRRDAGVSADRVVALADGEPTTPPDTARRHRTAAAVIGRLPPAAPSSVDAAITIGRVCAWLDRVDAIVLHPSVSCAASPHETLRWTSPPRGQPEAVARRRRRCR